MQNCSVGPRNAKKILSPKEKTVLDNIKLHGVKGNQFGHCSWIRVMFPSFAGGTKIDTYVPHIISWIFPVFHLFKKRKLSANCETKWSRKKWPREACLEQIIPHHNGKIHNMILKEGGVPTN